MLSDVTITKLSGKSCYWEKTFEDFSIQVYIPEYSVPGDIVNYGFMTPYLLVFAERKLDMEGCIGFADEHGLAEIASRYAGSVCFVYPTAEGGWENAPETIFASIINKSKISQFYENGIARMWNRFEKKYEGTYIRGALHRTCLFGYGASADYIVKHCLKTIEGNGLFGPGDISPVCAVLERISVKPQITRRDFAVVSIGNTDEVNNLLNEQVDFFAMQEKDNYIPAYDKFIKTFRRMVGNLEREDDLEQLGLCTEASSFTVTRSEDNVCEFITSDSFRIGYVAYYKKGAFDIGNAPLPLLMVFHGGGDSAQCMVCLSDWHKVVAKYGFLLVSIEDHTSSTASEAIQVLDQLMERYNIDKTRIYATGFSMGGIKTWDMFQEYPKRFAAVAPMDATVDVGENVFFQKVNKEINQEVILPVFYVGGEETPLPELPFQAEKCLNRMAYVLKVNKAVNPYNVKFKKQDKWKNKYFGVEGDSITYDTDTDKGSRLTMHHFISEDGNYYSVFASASRQQHEMRHLNCENAWRFMTRFSRDEEGLLHIKEDPEYEKARKDGLTKHYNRSKAGKFALAASRKCWKEIASVVLAMVLAATYLKVFWSMPAAIGILFGIFSFLVLMILFHYKTQKHAGKFGKIIDFYRKYKLHILTICGGALVLLMLGGGLLNLMENRSAAKIESMRTTSGKLPFDSQHYSDLKEEEVAEKLRLYGFNNVTFTVSNDLLSDDLDKKGYVKNITIDGKSTFSKDEVYNFDTPIQVVTYAENWVFAPVSGKDAKKMNYTDVEKMFTDAGFVNIKTEKVPDLITGWITKEYSVESITVGGSSEYLTQELQLADTEVIIRFHVFKKDK